MDPAVAQLRGSFRPSEQICMLRSLVRDKANLVAEWADWLRRMQKSLDQMNVRVYRAVADIEGATGMAIIRAVVKGERDPKQLAQLRDRRCQKSEEEITEQLSALAGGPLVQPGASVTDTRRDQREDSRPMSRRC